MRCPKAGESHLQAVAQIALCSLYLKIEETLKKTLSFVAKMRNAW
jgi:hypothetical protein